MKRFCIFVFFIIVIFLRFYNLAGRAPMGWDQQRDVQVLHKLLVTHRPTLIGPVVKGEGGFLLGPLYIYLLLPAFILFHQSPLALPVTTAILDILFLILVWRFFPHPFNFFSLFWGLSAFAFFFVPISWNVYLLIPYLSIFLILTVLLANGGSSSLFYWFFFLSTLVFHIHPSLFFIPPLFLLYLVFIAHRYPRFVHFLPALLPLLPLIMFDVRHHFLNTRLFWHFLTASPKQTINFTAFLPVLITKFTNTFSFFILGNQNVVWGSFLTILVLLSIFWRHNHLSHLSFLVIIINLIALLFWRDPNFAEYYLLPACLAGLFTILNFFPPLVFFFLLLNPFFYSFATQPHSLKTKQLLVQQITPYSPATLYFELQPGKDSLITYLASRHLSLSPQAPYKIFIQDVGDAEPSFSDGHLVKSGKLADYQFTVYIVK